MTLMGIGASGQECTQKREQIVPELLTCLIYYPEILHQSPLSAFPFSPNICYYNGKHSRVMAQIAPAFMRRTEECV